MSPKNKSLIYTAIVLIIIGAVFGVYWLSYGRYYESTDDAYIKGNVTTISARISGYVVSRDVKDNELVKAGQMLVFLDDRDFKAQENKAVAALNQKKAQVASLKATQTVNKDQIEQSLAKIDQVKAKLEYDEREQLRIKALTQKTYASQSQLDTVNANVKTDKAELVAAQASYHSAQDQVILTNTKIRQAEAAIEEAGASLEQAKLNLSYTTIKAPVDGVIANRSVDKGMYVSAGMPLFSLVPLNPIWIVANFKETQLKHIKPGQSVAVRVDAYSGKSLKGEVESITPGSGSEFALLPADNATGNFTKVVQRVPVKISITDSRSLKGKLYPGLSVEVRVKTRGK